MKNKELKTLNDLEFVDDAVRNKTSYLVNSTDLKIEAIKWYKKLDVSASWIKHFFNLTEDDLEDWK